MSASKSLCSRILMVVIFIYLIVSCFIYYFANEPEPKGNSVSLLVLISNVLVSVGTFLTLILI